MPTLATKKPYCLAIRPNGPSAWTWELRRRSDRTVLAEGKSLRMSRTMEAAEQDATDALANVFDRRQVDLETFDCNPANLAYYQSETNTRKVRDMDKTNTLQLTTQRKMAHMRDLLMQCKGQIAAALPGHCTPERMMRIAATAIQKTPKLLDCDPMSVLGCIMQCSQLGLEPCSILGHAHLVPFWNKKTNKFESQVIVGYRGLIVLAQRSGKVGSIHPAVVYSNDHYDYEEGLEPRLTHTPTREADKGEVVAAYAVAQMTNGAKQHTWMWRADIDKIRQKSQQPNGQAWTDGFAEMCKKTVIRRLCKSLPVEAIQVATALYDKADSGVAQGLGSLLDFSDPAIDVGSTDPDPKTLASEPAQKKPAAARKSKAPEPPATETTAEPPQQDSEADEEAAVLQSQLLEEFGNMIEAADTLTNVEEVEKLIMADKALSAKQRAALCEACIKRKKEIKAGRGSRSNTGKT